MEKELQAIIEAARQEFRRHGFRADGGSLNTNGTSFQFEPEAATGQMGFMVESIAASVGLRGLDLANPHGSVVRLSIAYDHLQSSGTNGFNLDYAVIARRQFGEYRYRLALLDRDVIQLVKEEGSR